MPLRYVRYNVTDVTKKKHPTLARSSALCRCECCGLELRQRALHILERTGAHRLEGVGPVGLRDVVVEDHTGIVACRSTQRYIDEVVYPVAAVLAEGLAVGRAHLRVGELQRAIDLPYALGLAELTHLGGRSITLHLDVAIFELVINAVLVELKNKYQDINLILIHLKISSFNLFS